MKCTHFSTAEQRDELVDGIIVGRRKILDFGLIP